MYINRYLCFAALLLVNKLKILRHENNKKIYNYVRYVIITPT